MNLVRLQDTKLMNRNLLHSYTLMMKNLKEKLRKYSHLPPQAKEKNNRNWKKEESSLFAYDVIVYVKTPKVTLRKLLELISDFNNNVA